MQNRLTLTTVISAALAVGFVLPASAQSSMREQREMRKRELSGQSMEEESHRGRKSEESAPAEAPRYPNATRKEPKVTTSRDGSEALKNLVEQFNAKNFQGVLSGSNAVLASNATPYEKAFADRLAGLAAAQLKDSNKAISFLKAAIDSNALDNNPHYDSMSDLAVQYQNSGKKTEALAVLEQFLKETQSTAPQYNAMRATLMSETGHSEEAIKLYADALAKQPNDLQAIRNLASAYEASGNTKKTYELLNDARKRGLAQAPDYKVLYSGYLVNNKDWKAAAEVLDDGISKNIIPKDEDAAKAYMVVAQSAYAEDKWNIALANYAKAASMSQNGEADLNRAKILGLQGKKAEAKAAAQAALAKGVKNSAEAQKFIK